MQGQTWMRFSYSWRNLALLYASPHLSCVVLKPCLQTLFLIVDHVVFLQKRVSTIWEPGVWTALKQLMRMSCNGLQSPRRKSTRKEINRRRPTSDTGPNQMNWMVCSPYCVRYFCSGCSRWNLILITLGLRSETSTCDAECVWSQWVAL